MGNKKTKEGVDRKRKKQREKGGNEGRLIKRITDGEDKQGGMKEAKEAMKKEK